MHTYLYVHATHIPHFPKEKLTYIPTKLETQIKIGVKAHSRKREKMRQGIIRIIIGGGGELLLSCRHRNKG